MCLREHGEESDECAQPLAPEQVPKAQVQKIMNLISEYNKIDKLAGFIFSSRGNREGAAVHNYFRKVVTGNVDQELFTTFDIACRIVIAEKFRREPWRQLVANWNAHQKVHEAGSKFRMVEFDFIQSEFMSNPDFDRFAEFVTRGEIVPQFCQKNFGQKGNRVVSAAIAMIGDKVRAIGDRAVQATFRARTFVNFALYQKEFVATETDRDDAFERWSHALQENLPSVPFSDLSDRSQDAVIHEHKLWAWSMRLLVRKGSSVEGVNGLLLELFDHYLTVSWRKFHKFTFIFHCYSLVQWFLIFFHLNILPNTVNSEFSISQFWMCSSMILL